LKKEKPLKSDLHALQLQQNLNCDDHGSSLATCLTLYSEDQGTIFCIFRESIMKFWQAIQQRDLQFEICIFYWSCWRIMKATDHGLIGTGIFLDPLSTGEKVCGCRCPALPLGFVTVCQYSSTCTLQTEIHRPWDANTML
jgi:hypothetical protein